MTLNLLTLSIKFTYPGTIKITIIPLTRSTNYPTLELPSLKIPSSRETIVRYVLTLSNGSKLPEFSDYSVGEEVVDYGTTGVFLIRERTGTIERGAIDKPFLSARIARRLLH